MKDFLVNLVVKMTGAGALWSWLDGKKTYGSAALSILTGLAGLAAEVAVPVAAHNAAGLLSIVQGLPHDPSWAALVFGLGLLGVGHKLDKAADAAASTAAVPLPNQP